MVGLSVRVPDAQDIAKSTAFQTEFLSKSWSNNLGSTILFMSPSERMELTHSKHDVVCDD